MPLVIADELLKQAGLTELEARFEFASRMFELRRLELWPAAQLCGMSKLEFAFELGKRGIDAFRYTPDDLRHDVETLNRLFPQP